MSLLFFVLFLVLIFLGLPVAFALLLGPSIALIVEGNQVYLDMLTLRLYYGIDSFPLMAVPFFILTGELMNSGGITLRLVHFSQSLVGHFRGGLAHVNILSSILFSGLSGSAVADTTGLGSMLIPAMEKSGYTKRFAAAVTAASSVIGPIIPPSGIMILYAFFMNVSVGALFAAGILPGLLIGVGLMLVTHIIAKKRNYPVDREKFEFSYVIQSTRKAFLPLLTPLIILGGILLGVFTPTEAAAVAAGYALFVSMFILKTLDVAELKNSLFRASRTSGIILLMVGAALAFSSMITLSGVASDFASLIFSVSENPLVCLFLINIFLFCVGMFLDAGPAILILGPILAPSVAQLGVEPVHFAVVMCVNLTIGLATPPMGLVLFAASGLTGEGAEKIAWEMAPFLVLEILVVFLITFVPEISLFIPKMMGYL